MSSWIRLNWGLRSLAVTFSFPFGNSFVCNQTTRRPASNSPRNSRVRNIWLSIITYVLKCYRFVFLSSVVSHVSALNAPKEERVEQVLLNKIDASRALNLSVRMVEGLIQRGEIRVLRVGRRVLVPRAEIVRFAADLSRTEQSST